jgi:putative transposase
MDTKSTYTTQTLKIVKAKDPLFKRIDKLAFKSKNIYNSALYLCRQHYFATGKVPSYTALDRNFKKKYPRTYYLLPSNMTQKILTQVQESMKDFVESSKEYKDNPSKYPGKPKLPKYKNKTTGRNILIMDYLSAVYHKQENQDKGYISFPKKTKLPDLKTHIDLSIPKDAISKYTANPLRQVRIVPLLNSYRIELVYYTTEVKAKHTAPKDLEADQRNYVSIDLGINNFASIVTYRNRQQDSSSIILNGKGLKSYNKYFNKKLASMKSHTKKSSNNYTSKAIKNLYEKRNRVYNDFYHKASRYIVNHCLEQDIDFLVVGYNEGWKTKSKLSKTVNQTFIQLGYRTFLDILHYKCTEAGIYYIEYNESYTSGTSFLDNEEAKKYQYNIKRRIHRGLFQHNNKNFKTSYINADINSAYQILHKTSEWTDQDTNQQRYDVYFRPDYITQSSIEPTIINLDTFDRKTKKQFRNKYTLKPIKHPVDRYYSLTTV